MALPLVENDQGLGEHAVSNAVEVIIVYYSRQTPFLMSFARQQKFTEYASPKNGRNSLPSASLERCVFPFIGMPRIS